jgi:hypothetical protein
MNSSVPHRKNSFRRHIDTINACTANVLLHNCLNLLALNLLTVAVKAKRGKLVTGKSEQSFSGLMQQQEHAVAAHPRKARHSGRRKAHDEQTVANHDSKRQIFPDGPDQGGGKFPGNRAIMRVQPATGPAAAAGGEQPHPPA